MFESSCLKRKAFLYSTFLLSLHLYFYSQHLGFLEGLFHARGDVPGSVSFDSECNRAWIQEAVAFPTSWSSIISLSKVTKLTCPG